MPATTINNSPVVSTEPAETPISRLRGHAPIYYKTIVKLIAEDGTVRYGCTVSDTCEFVGGYPQTVLGHIIQSHPEFPVSEARQTRMNKRLQRRLNTSTTAGPALIPTAGAWQELTIGQVMDRMGEIDELTVRYNRLLEISEGYRTRAVTAEAKLRKLAGAIRALGE